MPHSEDTGAAPDTEQAHDAAVEAERCVEQLATIIGQMGADPQMVKAVSQIADVLRKIGAGLAKGMKEEPAEPSHTMASAADEMMAERAAARQQPPA